MKLILITGGARSGKSAHAMQRGRDLAGDGVTFIATATATDDEMAARIARHRLDRPDAWTTVEAPRSVGPAIRAAATDVILLDCLTLLASNVAVASLGPDWDPYDDPPSKAEAGVETAVDVAVTELLEAAEGRTGTLIVVTNEIGMGVVPATPLGRWFRDATGRANRRVAASAEEVVLLVSGIPVTLKGGP